MPTYEYSCEACGERTEVHARLSDPPLERCPSCGGSVRKVFHPAGIVFKGSGFYATDSRSKKKETTTASTSGSSAGSSGSSAGPASSGSEASGGAAAAATPPAKPATEGA